MGDDIELSEPVQSCTYDGKPGWRYGATGKCYTYAPGDQNASDDAKNKAYQQGYAITKGQLESREARMKTRKTKESKPDADPPALSPMEALLSLTRASFAHVQEVGRTISAANEDKLKTAIATIQSVIDAIGGGSDAPTEDEPAAADAKAKESAARLKEGYSSAAWDASDGAAMMAGLLSFMSSDSDKPDMLAHLKTAFEAMNTWVQAKVAEIGSDTDQAGGGLGMMFGFESARPTMRLREAGLFESAIVPVNENAVGPDGTARIKIIQPGWGSSGYYSASVLERDGPEVFPAGTKMFWDHPTKTEETDRPERSLRDLAGELTTGATWDPNGPQGAGLYADAKVFEQYRPAVDELAPHIGVSIRAMGKATVGTAEGKTGPIIDELTASQSVDYVTAPGAGGRILQLFEAARQAVAPSPKREDDVMDSEKVKIDEATVKRAERAELKLLLRDARDFAETHLSEVRLPDAARVQIRERVTKNPPAKDGELDREAFTKIIDAEVKEVVDLLDAAGVGRPRGLGGASNPKPEDVDARIESGFRRLGLSETSAKVAAAGRS